MDVRLRPVAAGDVARLEAIGPYHDAYIAYGGDPKGHPNGGRDWAEGIISRIEAAYAGWIIEVDGALAGELKLLFHNPSDRNARLSIGLFRQDLRGQGIGPRAIALALDQAFGPLGLHRVDLHVLAKNTRAIRAYTSAGFQVEGRLRHTALIGDVWEDDLVMAILATDPRPNIS